MRTPAPGVDRQPERVALATLRHGGLERPYLLRLPEPRPIGPVPVVIELHGRGIPPASFDRWTGFSGMADVAGFALAMPGAIEEIWSDGRGIARRGPEPDDIGYLVDVIDDAIGRSGGDPARVYVVGMSNGATMAGRLATERPDRITAVAQVAGTAAASIVLGPHPARPVPILHIHGTADRFAPYAGGRPRGALARMLLRRPAGPAVGVDEWASWWVAGNGAGPEPEQRELPPDTVVRRWRGSSPDSDVVFYRIDGGGHTWPGMHGWSPPFLGRVGRGIDASSVIWSFFAAHS